MKTLGKSAAEAAAVWVEVGDLRPWGGNPRRNDAAVDQVAASIRRFGFGAPLLARKATGEIIAGHTRLKAAIKLGLQRVPVRYLDLDEAQAHAMALADNKTAEIAEWDDAALSKLMVYLTAEGIDLTTGTGFTDAEIAALLDGSPGPELSTEGPRVRPDDGRRQFRFSVDNLEADEIDQVFVRFRERNPGRSDDDLFLAVCRAAGKAAG